MHSPPGVPVLTLAVLLGDGLVADVEPAPVVHHTFPLHQAGRLAGCRRGGTRNAQGHRWSFWDKVGRAKITLTNSF